jgi:hypothetical protein
MIRGYRQSLSNRAGLAPFVSRPAWARGLKPVRITQIEEDESGMNKKAFYGITKCDTIKKDVAEE